MKNLLVTTALSFGIFACEHKKPDEPSMKEARNIDESIKVDASYRDFPSFEAWSKMFIGATEEQVIELLGKPKTGDSWDEIKGMPDSERVQYQWSYGSLYTESESYPFSSDFNVVFSKGLVVILEAPFGKATIVPAGRPTVPKLFLPEDNTEFSHFPRVIDLRWWSSSGTVPISYEVSIEVKYASGEWGVEDGLQKNVDSLHVAMVFVGSTKGRWRVRGRNQKGAGEWSDYRTFKFTQ